MNLLRSLAYLAFTTLEEAAGHCANRLAIPAELGENQCRIVDNEGNELRSTVKKVSNAYADSGTSETWSRQAETRPTFLN